MKALGVLESKWDPIRKKLVRRLLEEQDKMLWSYFAQKEGGTRSKGEDRSNCKSWEHVHGTFMREDGARGSWPSAQLSLQKGSVKIEGVLFVYYFLWFSLLSLSLIKSPC